MKIIKIFKEIRNYLFLTNVIRKNKHSANWKKHNLRAGWFGTMATVINLPPDVFEGEEVYYQAYVLEQMRPVNVYLESLNLHEIIYPSITNLIDKEQGIYAFLIKYKPIFNHLTFWWVVTRLIMGGTLLFLQLRYNLIVRIFSKIWEWILLLFGYIDSILS